MAVFSYIFGVVFAIISYIVYQKYYNGYTSIITKPEKRYDYIIVGAGTAGCVLAARLSEDPDVRVLLIEAGDHMGYFTRIPLTATAAQQGPNDWSVRTTPQKYSSFGLWDQTAIIPRGKGLGGSGQINFLLHGFGIPEDYDRWKTLGFRGWTFEDLKPYFKKAFGTIRSEFDSSYCGGDEECLKAPMKLQVVDESNELMRVFRQASASLADRYTLFRKATATVKDGARHQILDAYLRPALRRKNLHVMLRTQGVTIRFENRRASSVYILQEHRLLNNIFANNEIILCAGTMKTPQILISSGIGPRGLLDKLKVDIVAENAHVGANLHDHMNVPVFVSVRRPVSTTLAKVFSASTLWDYYWNKRGYLSFPPVAGVEYRNTSALMLFTMGSASERLLRDLSNYKSQVFRDTFPFYNDTGKEGFIFLGTCVQPRSRGRVTLRDTSTNVPAHVDPNYLHHEYDVRCMIKALRRAERLISTRPFQEIGARIHWPRPERCRTFWNYSKMDQLGLRRKRKTKPLSDQCPIKSKRKLVSPPDEYLACIIREVAVTGHHAAGTAAGGTVVDDQLRVKHVRGLRVMDASVLPSPISLYPNSVLVAMAEKAADIIKLTQRRIESRYT
ncbi:neither inactivation nor afterpotential protein G [Aricia agestis]|uniref:neither inactivation nor afterpotential protein G n=1 Tax=Aricia agestis TaxID=91739 RepID=UPI001C209451|nr:neither inactivation nor afterpotential protein G [Aricia agestis]